MGSIIGDLFRKVGWGIGEVFDGDIVDGVVDVLGGVGSTVVRTVGGAAKLLGLGVDDADPGTMYMVSVVAMLAKMAKADGRVDASEIRFMKELFASWELDKERQKLFQEFFNECKSSDVSISDYAKCVTGAAVEISPEDEGLDLRIGAYHYLFLMAMADDRMDDAELDILRTIPDSLGLKDEIFDLMSQELLEGGDQRRGTVLLEEAYRVLGVDASASDAEIQAAYKRKIGKFHPDKIQGKGLDPEWLEMANAKSAEINEAYNVIRNARIIETSRATSPKAEEIPKDEVPDFLKMSKRQGEDDSLHYACPHCGKPFSVDEASEEYLVPCPGCGERLDLTELNPL